MKTLASDDDDVSAVAKDTKAQKTLAQTKAPKDQPIIEEAMTNHNMSIEAEFCLGGYRKNSCSLPMSLPPRQSVEMCVFPCLSAAPFELERSSVLAMEEGKKIFTSMVLAQIS